MDKWSWREIQSWFGEDHGKRRPHHNRHHGGGNGTATCFLAGAMIETPAGSVPVETLRAGDDIIAYRDDVATSETLAWVGRSSIVTRGAPSDRSGHAVIVRCDAVAPGVPDRDLRVTAEHCFLFDGRFVPVRLLVNGMTIAFDAELTSYDYFHVETAAHAVIRANNMLTESYLDTGNRMLSATGDNVVALRGPVLSWNDDSAAPLETARAFVEPLHEAIRARAVALGFVAAAAPVTTQDADLRLETSDGRVIRPTRFNANRAVFAVPAGVESVVLVSRTRRPSDAIGPFVDDRRELGVLIGSVKLYDSDTTVDQTVHFDSADLVGWHGVEAAAMRWTSGRATLPLRARAPHSVGILAIEILSAGPYVLDEAQHACAC